MTPALTPRQLDYLEMRARGLTHKAIAHRWGVEVTTVKNFGVRIRRKLGVETEIEALRITFGWRLPTC